MLSTRHNHARVIDITRKTTPLLYILLMIAVIISVDLLFFRNLFWDRLLVNISIILVDAIFYLKFLKQP